MTRFIVIAILLIFTLALACESVLAQTETGEAEPTQEYHRQEGAQTTQGASEPDEVEYYRSKPPMASFFPCLGFLFIILMAQIPVAVINYSSSSQGTDGLLRRFGLTVAILYSIMLTLLIYSVIRIGLQNRSLK